MASDDVAIAPLTVEEGAKPKPPEPQYVCFQCGGPRLAWQTFCGAACTAVHEARMRGNHGPSKIPR